MTKVIVDASALLALFKPTPEEGSDVIQKLLPNAVLSAVNFAETSYCLIRHGVPYLEALHIIEACIPEIVPFTLRHARIVSRIYPTTRPYGLSFGDLACLALGLETGYTVYTADQIWEKIELPNLHVRLIRKSTREHPRPPR